MDDEEHEAWAIGCIYDDLAELASKTDDQLKWLKHYGQPYEDLYDAYDALHKAMGQLRNASPLKDSPRFRD